MMAAGFHSTFLTGGGGTPTAPAGGGGYPTAAGAYTETAGPARAEIWFVYQLSDFSQRVNKVFFFPFHTEALQ